MDDSTGHESISVSRSRRGPGGRRGKNRRVRRRPGDRSNWTLLGLGTVASLLCLCNTIPYQLRFADGFQRPITPFSRHPIARFRTTCSSPEDQSGISGLMDRSVLGRSRKEQRLSLLFASNEIQSEHRTSVGASVQTQDGSSPAQDGLASIDLPPMVHQSLSSNGHDLNGHSSSSRNGAMNGLRNGEGVNGEGTQGVMSR